MGDLTLFVGSLNRAAPYFQGARGKGLAVFGLDEASLRVTQLAETDEVDNPSFLSVSPTANMSIQIQRCSPGARAWSRPMRSTGRPDCAI